MMAAALSLLLAWTLLAFGAVYEWALWPALVATLLGVAVTAVHRRGRGRAPHTQWLDFFLVLTIVAAAAQLVPLPVSIRNVLSPGAADFVARTRLAIAPAPTWSPLSLAPSLWLFGAGILVLGCATFWWSREALSSRGMRQMARIVALLGLVAAVLAFAQAAMFPDGRIYGFWRPIATTAHPMGPLVSRSHFAAWIVVALSITVGYLVAHGRTHWSNRRTRLSVLVLSDARALWLALAIALMVASLLISQSRAGVVGLGVSAVAWVVLQRRRRLATATVGAGVALIGLAAVISLWTTPAAMVDRFERSYSGTDGGRPQIWQMVAPLVGEFPVTGIGLGAFEAVMPAYQPPPRNILVNHAHSQALHMAVEGGVLVGLPCLLALLAFVRLAWKRVTRDDSAMTDVRRGAAAGLAGLATVAMFDVPTLTPAVVVLAALAAAMVVHASEAQPDPSTGWQA